MHFKPSKLYLFIASVSFSSTALSDDYYFDPSLFQGSAFAQDLERFNQQEQPLVGEHQLDIYVNDILVAQRDEVLFKISDDGVSSLYLSPETLRKSRIRFNERTVTEPYHPVSELSDNLHWSVDQSTLQLRLYIPQKDLYSTPRGFIPVSEWDAGSTALFARHNTNIFRTENRSSNYNYTYAWSNIYSGINFGLWQARHQGNFQFYDNNRADNKTEYNSVRTWVQRPISEIESLLTIGESYTNSSLLSSLSFKGAKIGTDKRMWPQSRRGYAPEVRGIANTTARVVIRQQGQIIHEVSVPPGPFVINDLFNTRMQGDLEVEVIEANGQVSSFVVPFAATPESLRAGTWSYDFAIGKVRQFDDVSNNFMEGTLQYGLNNQITTNLGARVGENYYAGLLGGVYASSFGAFGLNTTWSRAMFENDETQTGWRVDASYSKTFSATRTNIVLAAYRHSTEGFRDLQDVLGVERQNKNGETYYSDTLKQRNRFSLALSQPMDNYGSLHLSGSTSDYYDNRSRVTQLQLGYSNTWNHIGYRLNLTRQQVVSDSRHFNDNDKRIENSISLGVSIPLDFGGHRSSLAFDASRSSSSINSNVSIAGSAGENRNFTYAVHAGLDNPKEGSSSTSWGANVQQNTSLGALRGSYFQGDNYRQYGVGTSGTLIVHSGGATIGPFVSDTFALVHAPGAKGATVRNGQGATIDRFGYAIMPSLSPYQYNNVSLEMTDINSDVELQGSGTQVVPYAGAMAKVTFRTVVGKAVLINTTLNNGDIIPMGANVLTANNESIGMVGQGRQIYARLSETSGKLRVMWGEDASQQCTIDYQLPKKSDDVVINLNLPCM